jgi:large subunit ribosomal protein L3
MKCILGKKIGMTQILKDDAVIPVTLIEAGPCVITQLKSKNKDGYESVQIGFGAKKKMNKPLQGHLKDIGNLAHLREFKSSDKKGEFSIDGVEMIRGSKFDASIFKEGDVVMVSAISKAKGFQGVVKRHGFSGGPASHGQKHSHRAPGSIGSVWPQRVLRGQRMAGRMGGKRITIRNLKIIEIDALNNILAIKGAVPGKNGILVEIKSEK